MYDNYKETEQLTPRELEVLKYLVLGKNNSEIANELSISVHTVKAHLVSIFHKLNASNRVEVAVYAVKERIINDDEDENCDGD